MQFQTNARDIYNRYFVFSMTVILSVAVASPAQDGVQRRALLIGVSTYEKAGFTSLKYPEDDVKGIEIELKKAGFDTTLMLSSLDASNPLRATKANIERQLQTPIEFKEQLQINSRLKPGFIAGLADLNKEDLVLVVLAGHGCQELVVNRETKRKEATPFFCPVDANRTISETWVSINRMMKGISQYSGSEKNLILIDACRDNPSRGRGIDGKSISIDFDNLAICFSSSAGTKSFESDKLEHGIFSYYVIKGLKGEAANPSKQVTWGALTDYVRSKVAEQAPKLVSNPQNPHVAGSLKATPVLIPTVELSMASTDPKRSKSMTPDKTGFNEKKLVRSTNANTSNANTSIDLRTETPYDFPQFLGQNRDGRVSGIKFGVDWKNNQPELLWRQPIGSGHSGFATRNGYAVTMEQHGDKEATVCYELATGKTKWVHFESKRHESLLGKVGPRSTPTIYDGMVYTLGGNGTLVCLDSNGSLIWKRELLNEFGTSLEEEKKNVTWGRAASPLVYQDKVIVPAGGPKSKPVSLVAYDRKTGDEIWRAGNTQVSYASPIVVSSQRSGAANDVVVSVNESNVTAHNPTDGKIVWTVADWPGDSAANPSASQPVVLPGQLLLTKGYGQGARLIQILGEKLIWSNARLLKTKFTNCVYKQFFVYGLSDGRLECVDIRDGTRVWKSQTNYGNGQILFCGDHILVLAEKGYVALVQTKESLGERENQRGFEELARFQAIEGASWNTFAINGNKLLVRNSNEVACYKMPLASPVNAGK